MGVAADQDAAGGGGQCRELAVIRIGDPFEGTLIGHAPVFPGNLEQAAEPAPVERWDTAYHMLRLAARRLTPSQPLPPLPNRVDDDGGTAARLEACCDEDVGIEDQAHIVDQNQRGRLASIEAPP